MARRKGRRLVIDACVAQSAGGEGATFPLSKHCRDTLKAIYDICHRAVFTPEIHDDWRRHRSRYTRKWLRWMNGARKIDRLDVGADEQLRDALEAAASTDKRAKAMLKDVHLIEAARGADHVVVSSDREARKLFAAVARQVKELRDIVWADPSEDLDDLVAWLKRGAPPEAERCLPSLPTDAT